MSTDGTNHSFEPERSPPPRGSRGVSRQDGPFSDGELAFEGPLQRALAAGGIGSWHKNLAERRMTINAQEARILGREPVVQHIDLDEFICAIIHPEDRPRVEGRFWEAVESRDEFRMEFRIVRPDGAVRWVESLGGFPYNASEMIDLHGIHVDITDRKRTEEELHTADQRKNEFLAVLGHELRNPLMAISSAAELIEEADLDHALVRRAQRIISRQTRQMTRLIDGLLDVSRITRGKLHLHRTSVDLVDVVHDLIEDRQEKLGARRLVIDVRDQPLVVDADPVRISQIFDNLLVNAIKFTDDSDTIGIEISRDGRCAVAAVTDTGAGIEPELLPHVFEPFEQAPQDISRARGGLGLGLALARELVELHGGSISAYSDGPGRGSRFVVELPISRPRADSPNHDRGVSVAGTNVLLVEDNLDIVEVLSLQLDQAGCEVVSALSATDAMALLREQRPDVVLCDLGLPEISGYELAAKIREDPQLADLPVIALTGFGDVETRRRALSSGFDAFVIKPVDVARLLATLAELSS